MKVAIVHHWFVTHGGGERVAAVLAGMFPEADIFTLFASPEGTPPVLAGRSIKTSILQRIPGAQYVHRHLLPLYPFAVEQLDLTGYDLVLTSDSGPMKGVLTRQDAIHICYCHSPMRYLWDGYHQYISDMSRLARIPFSLAAHYVRNWDYIAAQRVTHFIANSSYVASRIRHYYGRESSLVHPPVDTSRGWIVDDPSDYYLAAGRLVAYKRTDLLIKTCNKLGRKLVIAGTGPEEKQLRRIAGPTISFLGYVTEDQLWRTYAECRALLFAADEDFGMVPVEAQACGRPVIAYGKGGSLETVRGIQRSNQSDPVTGVFFDHQTTDSLERAILQYEQRELEFSPLAIQSHASSFDTTRFIAKIRRIVAGTQPKPNVRVVPFEARQQNIA